MSYATPPYSRSSSPASSGAFDVRTLVLTAIASAAAAYTCSKLWAPGTLASAAFTPVLVALIREALAKPTEVVARAVPVRGVVRSASQGPPQPPQAGAGAEAGSPAAGEVLGGDYTAPGSAPAPAFAADAEVTWVPQPGAIAGDPAARVAQAGEIQYHSGRRGLRGWRLAVVTGLLGFLICAVVFTVPELVAGGSATGDGRDTTLFGGGKERERAEPAVTTQTTTAPAKTVTAPLPTETVTVPPAATTTVPSTTTPVTPSPTTPVPTTVPGEPAVGQPPAVQPPG